MKLHPKQKTVPRGKVKNKEVRSYKFIGTDQAEEVNKYLNQPGLPLDDKVLALVELTRDYERGQLWKGQEIVDHINKTIAELKIGRAESHAFNLAEGGFTVKELPTGNPSKTALWWAYTRAVELHKLGLLGRIRLCARPACLHWFFAVLPQQTFHTDTCRTETTSSNPKFRERRKKYMQQLRKGQKKGGK
jgi:hypothetical protein